MSLFRKKTLVEAITFAELVEHGRTHGGNIVNGMPWSFTIWGLHVTHENDQCYLIEGDLKMTPEHMLVKDGKGVNICLSTWEADEFKAEFEPA